MDSSITTNTKFFLTQHKTDGNLSLPQPMEYNMTDAYKNIIAKINLSNNGHLLLSKFNADEKVVLNEMRKVGIVAPALFCGYGAVKLSDRYLEMVKNG